MKQVARTIKVAALLLAYPIAFGAWLVLGPNGYYWSRGVHHTIHGMGWTIIIVYSGVAVWLIGMSYYDEVIRPRKELRRRQEQERREQDAKRMASLSTRSTSHKWTVGNDQYDAEAIKRYNQNQQKK